MLQMVFQNVERTGSRLHSAGQSTGNISMFPSRFKGFKTEIEILAILLNGLLVTLSPYAVNSKTLL